MRSSTTLFLQYRVGIMGLPFGKRKQVGSLWWCFAAVKETVGGRNDGDDDLRPHIGDWAAANLLTICK
ncbi:hypothetical protein M8C21_015089, partial [Ambrosia artemisiifolia]